MNQRNVQILKIALPAIVTNITVPLLGLVDTAIVGHMGDAAYIGAIAVGSMIFNLVYWVFGFLRMGSSGMIAQALGSRDMTAVLKDDVKQALQNAIPLKRTAHPIDIANAVLFLLSDEADYITGQAIEVDGGLSL